MHAIIDVFLLLAFNVKYLRNYLTDMSTPTYVTTSARTNMALSKASHVFLTFWKQKAFDKYPHELLLLKLKAHGITGQCNNIIRNVITGRTMTVRVGDELFTWEPILSGVHQGSVLGPLSVSFVY